MDYEKIEQLQEWFDKYHDYNAYPDLNFENLDNKPHPCQQVSALVFLASKLKDKSERFFLHGEHDTVYIGTFDAFEDFTEEDVKIAVAHGVFICEDGDGFQMYASM